MMNLKVGEQKIVTVDKVELGYITIEGIEYKVRCSDDFEEKLTETNTMDTYFVKDEKVYILSENSEFPTAEVKRIK